MNLTFKFVIDEDKRFSLVIFKENSVELLLKDLISILKIAFPNASISSRPNYYHITGISNTAVFSIAKSLLEELYLRFLDDEVDDSDFDSSLFIA